MPGAGPPRILDALPVDGRPWRLDFVGDITRNADRKTPLVKLSFSPFLSTDRSRWALASGENYDWARSVTIEGGVPDLQHFIVGSLWTAGMPEKYPDYEQLALDVDVSVTTSLLCRSDGHTSVGDRLILRSYYRIPDEVANGHVVFIPMKEGFDGLVIPCSEIFRFYYYGVSGKLGRALCDRTYLTEREKVVSEKTSSWPDEFGQAYIRLGKYLDDDDRFEMARITFSPLARSEAKALVPRAASGAATASYPLLIRLPFEGHSRFVVQGKRIKTARGRWVFLVFRIIQCSAAMPYTHLDYNRQNPGKQGFDGVEELMEPKAKYRGRYTEVAPADPEASLQFTQRVDPSSTDVPHKIEGVLNRSRYTAPFTDRFVKRAAKTRTTAQMYSERIVANGSWATGAGSLGSAARAAAHAEGGERGLEARLADFMNVVALLPSAGTDVVVESVAVRAFPRPRAPGETGISRWAFLGRIDVVRRAVVAIVWISDRAHVIIEIECRPPDTRSKKPEYFKTLFLSPPAPRSVSLAEVRAILDRLIVSRGVINGNRWIGSIFERWISGGLHHYGQTVEERAATLFERLTSINVA